MALDLGSGYELFPENWRINNERGSRSGHKIRELWAEPHDQRFACCDRNWS